MRITFRQGIIAYPTSGPLQVFLAKTGVYVSFLAANGQTDIAFAHGSSDYLHTESVNVTNAWGPIPASTDTWIYWDINLQTAVRTFGQTYLQPQFGGSFPASPSEDQHFFNTTTKKMSVYQSGGWREVLRVFAAKVNNAVFTALGSGFPSTPFAGTQVGLATSCNAGRIVFDNVGAPIRRVNREFFNTESDFFVNGSPVNTIRLEANVLTGTALENVASFQVVKYTDFGEVELAAYNDISTTVIAMSMESLLVNDTGTLVVQGVVTNPAWTWTTAGAPLWVDDSGELTELDLHVTAVLTHPVGKPPIARVLTPTSIFFDQGMGGKGDQGLPGDPADTELASTTTFGITKLSVSPVSSLNPIAVGDNDPRLAPPAQPLNRIVFGTGSGLSSDVDFTYVPTTGQLYVNTVDGTTVSAPLTATPGAIIMFAGSAGGVDIDGASIELTAGDASGTGGGGQIILAAGTSPGGASGGFHVYVDGANQFDINSDTSWSVNGITGAAGTVLTSNGPGGAPSWETPSGGGSAEPDNQIVYGAGGGTTVDSDPDFTYNPVTGQLFVNTPDGSVSLDGLSAPGEIRIFTPFASIGDTAGGDFLVRCGYGNDTGQGGDVLFETGFNNNAGSIQNPGNGGDFRVTTGDGGSVALTDLNGLGARAGVIELTSGSGGNVFLTNDSTVLDAIASSNGADILITGGSGGGADIFGTIGDGEAEGGVGATVHIQAGSGGSASIGGDGTATGGNAGDIILETREGGIASVGTGTATVGRPGNHVSITQGGHWIQRTGSWEFDHDSEAKSFVLRGGTFGAETKELFCDGPFTSLSPIRMVIPFEDDILFTNWMTWVFEVRVVARETGGDQGAAGYVLQGVIDYNGTTTIIGAVQKTVLAETDPAWDANVYADNTNSALAISVTGAGTAEIRWAAYVRVIAVGDLFENET